MDGSRLRFANPGGAALLGFSTCAAAAGTQIAPSDLATQIGRIGATLAPGAGTQLARLRGLGLSLGRPLTCACSAIAIGSATGILVRAVDAAGPTLSLAERARRLIEDHADAIVAFAPDGTRLHATAEARRRLVAELSLTQIKDKADIWAVGEGTDKVTLALVPEVLAGSVDLAPIADAMASMVRNAAPPGEISQRHPMRFIWETDADNRFTITTQDFLDIAGDRTVNLLGRFWGEISAKLALDPEGLVAHSMMSRDTWGTMPVRWPMASGERMAVELSGIPAFDRQRMFLGYRGFGVLRDRIIETPTIETPARAAAPVTEKKIEPDPSEDILEPLAKPDAHPLAEQTAAKAPAPENVVPFRFAGQDGKHDSKHAAAHLNPVERTVFHEIGSRLAARLKSADDLARGRIEPGESDMAPPQELPLTFASASSTQRRTAPALRHDDSALVRDRPILDKLPTGVLIYRLSSLLYANAAFLKSVGYASLGDFAQAGGIDSLFIESDTHSADEGDRGQSLRIERPGQNGSIAARLVSVEIDGENGMVLLLSADPAQPPKPQDGQNQFSTLASILDIAADGVVMLDRDGRILKANVGAGRLFGYEADEFAGQAFGSLFAPESERVALARLERLVQDEEAPAGDDTREIIGRRRQGGFFSLHLILGRVDADGEQFCAVFRDITRWKDTEQQLVAARQQAEKASSAKSDFLAKISHEMRTPLNAIIGFSEVMMAESFGPVGNERYRDYLKDINTSGSHLVSLLNDLLDLSKIEAGKMELNFERVNLNEVTQQSVAIMQPQAARARVIVRSALSMTVPGIIADVRSVRQIVLNLLSNSIKFTGAGGQVIVSTAATERGEVMLRVRDTGIGMSAKDIEIALQPFRQLTVSPRAGDSGTGLGLPLTKALVEANRARFTIKSAVNAGTLVEIVFPAARVLSE